MSGRGRPRAFERQGDLQDKLDTYFAQEDRPTMAGICVHLDICKDTFSAYGMGQYDDDSNNFSDLINKARKRVESVVEARMLYEGAGAGAIFWLKNHAGYTDQREVKNTGDMVLKVSKDDADL